MQQSDPNINLNGILMNLMNSFFIQVNRVTQIISDMIGGPKQLHIQCIFSSSHTTLYAEKLIVVMHVLKER